MVSVCHPTKSLTHRSMRRPAGWRLRRLVHDVKAFRAVVLLSCTTSGACNPDSHSTIYPTKRKLFTSVLYIHESLPYSDFSFVGDVFTFSPRRLQMFVRLYAVLVYHCKTLGLPMRDCGDTVLIEHNGLPLTYYNDATNAYS